MAFNEQSGREIEGVVHDTTNETIAGIKTFTSDPIIPDEVYGPGWNASLEPPTKNAVYDIIETLAVESEVVHNTGAEAVAGVKTFSDDPIIPDEVYGAPWNASLEPPTKNAVYDKIETVIASISGFALDSGVVHTTGAEAVAGVKTFSSDPIIPDEVYGPGWNGSLEPPTKNALYDIIETLGADTGVVHLAGAENITGVKTFTVDPVVPDEVYDATAWNNNMEPPTKNAIRDKIETLATDSLVVHQAGAENITGVKTFTVDPIIPDEVYGGSWDASLEPPTKNALYDKIQTLAVDAGVVHTTGAEAVAGVKTFSSDPIIPDEVYGALWDASLEPPTKNAIYDKIQTLAVDAGVVHTTGAEAIAGEKTFSTAPLVATEAYGAPWSGSLSVPTKDALYTKLQSMIAAMPEKQFYALLDQTGTSAPTLEEGHSNTLGVVPTYGRTAAGTYTITALSSFPIGRTNIQLSTSAKHASLDYQHSSASVITITVKQDASDVGLSDLVGKISLAITVFPA